MKRAFLLIGIVILGGLIGAGCFWFKNRLEQALVDNIAEIDAKAKDYSISYDSINVNPLLLEVVIENPSLRFVRGFSLTADSVTVIRPLKFKGFQNIEVDMEGFAIRSLPLLDQYYALMGYNGPLKADTHMELRLWGEAFDLNEYSYEAPGLGRLEMSLHGDGLNRELIEEDITHHRNNAFGKIVVRDFECSFTDDGLHDRLIRSTAALAHTSELAVTTELKQLIHKKLYVNNPPDVQEVAQTLLTYLDDPGTIGMTLTMQRDVPLGDSLKEYLPKAKEAARVTVWTTGKEQ